VHRHYRAGPRQVPEKHNITARGFIKDASGLTGIAQDYTIYDSRPSATGTTGAVSDITTITVTY